MLIPHTDTSAVTAVAKWIFAVLLTPLYTVYSGAEWYLLTVLAAIAVDYRLGRGESQKRYSDAKDAGDAAVMLHYEWRKSRAWRRTLTKCGDYFLIVTLGVFIGHAFLPHVGLAAWWGGFVATAVCLLCELLSIAEHFLYLHGVEVSGQGARNAVTRFIISLARRKDPDIGDALGDALNGGKKEEARHDRQEEGRGTGHPPDTRGEDTPKEKREEETI